MKVLRIVKSGKVFYSKEYTRMVKRNAHVVLFESGKVGEIEFFVWERQTGITLAVFSEIQPDLEKPFFFCEAGHHTLRMKQERYYFTWHLCIIRFRLVTLNVKVSLVTWVTAIERRGCRGEVFSLATLSLPRLTWLNSTPRLSWNSICSYTSKNTQVPEENACIADYFVLYVAILWGYIAIPSIFSKSQNQPLISTSKKAI